jgi:hypothetical protein
MQKEIPIPFSTPMVQAIIELRKTMTRRLRGLKNVNNNPDDWIFSHFETNLKGGLNAVFKHKDDLLHESIPCPFGKPDDLLWVRESWMLTSGGCYWYKASFNKSFDFKNAGLKVKPSIHMPKVAARIWLEVTDIRVERLHNITEEDAMAEGVERWVEERLKSKPTHYKVYHHEPGDDSTYSTTAKMSFETLWQSLNGVESWTSNPWVWVVSFEVLSTTGNPETSKILQHDTN